MGDNNSQVEDSSVVKSVKPLKPEVQRRRIDPYDLSSSDNPGSIISQPLLRGPNFNEWSSNLRTALRSRKKFGFVDGTIPNPGEESEDNEDWWTNNALVLSWIKLTIVEDVRSSLPNIEVASELWDHITRRYSVKNGQRVQRLKSEIAMCRQHGLTIEAYYAKLMQLWTALAEFRVTKNCGCPTGHNLEKEREEDRLHEFLKGLDDSVFGAAKSNLLSRDPLPTLDEAFQVLSQDEDSKRNSLSFDERSSDTVAYAVRTSTNTQSMTSSSRTGMSREDRSKLLCSVCNRKGHVADNCFRALGYPTWWGNRPRGSLLSSSDRTNEPASTRGFSTSSARAHATAVASPAHQANQISAQDRTGLTGLTDAQWQSLVQLLNERTKPPTTEHLSGMLFIGYWIIDTGATNHMTGSLDFLTNVRDISPLLVKLPDGRFTSARKLGTVVVNTGLTLQNVLFVEGLECHLVSVSQLNKENATVFQITDKLCIIQDRITRTLIGVAEESQGLYFLRGLELAGAIHQSNAVSVDLWHHRLGHPSQKALDLLSISGVSTSSVLKNKACEICIRAKQTRCSFPISTNKTTSVFELIHCDLWGPYRTMAHSGARYFLTIVDDYSRSVWTYLLNSKQDVSQTLRNFIALIERQFSTLVKTIRSDNGTEFLCLTSYFREKGILHETSCVGTPQQNGRVERKHRHLLNVARALLFQASLPLEFWGEGILTAAYLINRTPTPLLDGLTPFEKLYQRPPPLNHLRTFGCLCYAHNQHHRGDKFTSRSIKCIFLGYPYGKKGWRVYDLDTGKIFVSRDVIFSETEFPFSTVSQPTDSSLPREHLVSETLPPASPFPDMVDEMNPDHVDDLIPPVDFLPDDIVGSSLLLPTSSSSKSPSVPMVTSPAQNQSSSMDSGHSSDPLVSPTLVSSSASSPKLDASLPMTDSSVSPVSETEIVVATEHLGRGQRTRNLPPRLHDYVLQTAASGPARADSSAYAISHYVDCSRFSPNHSRYLLALTSIVIPRSYAEAMEDERWREAIRAEMDALEELGTWTVEDLPIGKHAIGSKWVFTVKLRADGTVERYKARLVALGNHQVEGSDFKETFAPVAKMTSVRSFLQVASSLDWEVHQMDVHNAFLHGDLDEEVYMRLPPGFRGSNPKRVCRLWKSLYGLHQSPRCWFAKLHTALLEYGFVQSIPEYSLFSLARGKDHLMVLVYVDDLIITGSSLSLISSFKAYLSRCFHMKDLGLLKFFLGIEVARSPHGIYLCQRKYVLDIVAEAGLLAAKPAAFPMEQNHKLALATGRVLKDVQSYRRLVGRLIYLAVTRPDLSYSVHVLTQFMNAPQQAHWDAALRVVRYLKGTPGQGILLRAHTPLSLVAWCDSDWSTCPISRRSITGWFIQFGGSPISWRTKKQDVVSRSSAEAEYRAMAFTVQELLWLKNLLRSLGVDHSTPIPLFCDNQAALHIAANPVFHERTKHIENDCHFVRDELVRKTISFSHVSTSNQLADIFTKALGRREFTRFVDKLGVCDLHSPT